MRLLETRMDSVEKGLRELLRASMARTSEVESKLGTLEQNYDLCKAELAGVIADAKTQSLRLDAALKKMSECEHCAPRCEATKEGGWYCTKEAGHEPYENGEPGHFWVRIPVVETSGTKS
jgi:uncharacterized Fe-S radical SAM superfamily protein PflX